MQAAVECLSEHLPLDIEGAYTADDVFQILLRAASRGDSIEQTTKRLEGAPSGHGVR